MQNRDLLTVKDVIGRLKVSRPTIYNWVRERSFPEPVRFGKRVSRWRLSDVQRWEEENMSNPLNQDAPLSLEEKTHESSGKKHSQKGEKIVPCNFRVSLKFRRRLKSFAASRDVAMVDVFTEAVNEFIRRSGQ